ncbi:MAG: glycerate kinase [Chitinophagales bacterium]
MNILICPDKFKGSLSAHQVAHAIEKGVKRFAPDFNCNLHPLADGGDGSMAVLLAYLNADKISTKVCNPLGVPIEAHYYLSEKTAFIELAEASGFALLTPNQRNPMFTSTYGTGEQILDAINRGAKEIFLFLGGSATNDAGMGIAHALGFQFFDDFGEAVLPTGENLYTIKEILPPKESQLQNIRFTCLCDVKNPLLGSNGASRTYAAQKGALPSEIEHLESAMAYFAALIHQKFDINITYLEGGGAAGGVSAGLFALLNAQIKSGIQTIFRLTQFEQAVQNADLIISGEGKLDEQTLEGKVILGVSQLCLKHKKPLLLVVGHSQLNTSALSSMGVVEVLSVLDKAGNMETAMANGGEIVEELVLEYMNEVKNISNSSCNLCSTQRLGGTEFLLSNK